MEKMRGQFLKNAVIFSPHVTRFFLKKVRILDVVMFRFSYCLMMAMATLMDTRRPYWFDLGVYKIEIFPDYFQMNILGIKGFFL